MSAVEAGTAPAATEPRRFPPVAELATVALALVVVGGIWMASHAPRRPPLVLPAVLAVGAYALFAVNIVLLARLRDFAWSTFWLVFKWALLAYVVQAGMIGYVFVHDHVRGAPLVVLMALLVMFAVDVALIIAFTVARFQSPQVVTTEG
jgi:hypothetical protein